ncbi:uncharacterized protein LOC143206739 [Rhynchophorus ferrugineus]|uniref:uncharacterized protein LOC143206739 n=1 Tax=Rhynchophorus ferrugineus TaxID=354439 RepID=UPI003FCC9805
MEKLFNCDYCKNAYCSISNVYRHMRRFHPEKIEPVKEKVQRNLSRCPLCEYTSSRSQLVEHIQSFHNIKFEQERLEFDSIEDFEKWKENVERITKASFPKVTGTYIGRKIKASKFECHRSGIYKSASKGERHLKHNGSVKMNAYCPACIRLIQDGTKYEVEFIKTHVGHENSLANLFLSKTDREIIAAKLTAKVSKDTILNEIRENKDSDSLERLHLLTRKDLYNIEKSNSKFSQLPKVKQEYDTSSGDLTNKEKNYRDNFVKLEQITVKEIQIKSEVEESTPYIPEIVMNQNYDQKDTFNSAKEEVRALLLHIGDLLEKCKTVSGINIIKSALVQIETDLNALKYKKEI